METPIAILYVDDEPINVLLFERMFRKKYKVFTAHSGYLGLEILKTRDDLKVIITDMRMPGMNGIEFIQNAKKIYPNIIYYILTGYDITPEIQKSLDSGLIYKYFQKPFNMNDIDASISAKFAL